MCATQLGSSSRAAGDDQKSGWGTDHIVKGSVQCGLTDATGRTREHGLAARGISRRDPPRGWAPTGNGPNFTWDPFERKQGYVHKRQGIPLRNYLEGDSRTTVQWNS